MKKIILNSIAILGVCFAGFSQDNIKMKVTGSGMAGNTIPTGDLTDFSSGHAPYIFNATANGIVDIYVDVENTTGTSKAWRISRFNEPNVVSDWSSMVCVGLCFSASSLNPYCTPASSNGILSLADDANGEISLHITTATPGTSNYKLYLGDCTTYEDSIEIQINYSVGLKEVKQTPTFSMYPNPSDEFVAIQLNNSKNGTVKIVDLVGNVVYSEAISSSTKLNVSEFKNGVYFVTIEADGMKLSSRKLVVKH